MINSPWNSVLFIGPGFTKPQFRCLGLHPYLLSSVLSDVSLHNSVAFVHVSKSNVASSKGIERAGFDYCADATMNGKVHVCIPETSILKVGDRTIGQKLFATIINALCMTKKKIETLFEKPGATTTKNDDPELASIYFFDPERHKPKSIEPRIPNVRVVKRRAPLKSLNNLLWHVFSGFTYYRYSVIDIATGEELAYTHSSKHLPHIQFVKNFKMGGGTYRSRFYK